MAKEKKVISVTMETDVIDMLDMFAEQFGFNRSGALNFILKNIIFPSGSYSMIDDMVCDMYHMESKRFDRGNDDSV